MTPGGIQTTERLYRTAAWTPPGACPPNLTRKVQNRFELIKHIAKNHGVGIEVMDLTDKSEQQELIEDLIQIITVFSCQLQSRRKKRTQELLSDLKEGDKQ